MSSAPCAASDAAGSFQPASSPDYLPSGPLRELQSQRLRQVVRRVYDNVAVYRQRMQKHGLTPAAVQSIDDLGRLPFTGPADVEAAYPLGWLTVPIQQVARLQHPSGTAGRSVLIAYTRHDLEVWAEALVRSLAACGLRAGDILQNACGGYDLFTDGLGLHAGAERLGATVIPISGGDADRQLTVLKDCGISAVCCPPSYFLYLLERAEKAGLDLHGLPLRAAVFVTEAWSEAIRRRIEQAAGIRAFDVYGVPEIIGPGIGAECGHQNGVHVWEDHFFPEIVDPATGAPLPDGQEGELALTTLSQEAMPLIRYRTGERTAMLAEPCPCGRTMRRIRRVGRHHEDMFVIQGVSVRLSQVEAALRAVEELVPEYQVVLMEEQGVDQAEVQVEVTPQIVSDRVSAMEALCRRLAHEIEHATGVRVTVRLMEPRTIHRGPAAARRLVDRRNT